MRYKVCQHDIGHRALSFPVSYLWFVWLFTKDFYFKCKLIYFVFKPCLGYYTSLMRLNNELLQRNLSSQYTFEHVYCIVYCLWTYLSKYFEYLFKNTGWWFCCCRTTAEKSGRCAARRGRVRTHIKCLGGHRWWALGLTRPRCWFYILFFQSGQGHRGRGNWGQTWQQPLPLPGRSETELKQSCPDKVRPELIKDSLYINHCNISVLDTVDGTRTRRM